MQQRIIVTLVMAWTISMSLLILCSIVAPSSSTSSSGGDFSILILAILLPNKAEKIINSSVFNRLVNCCYPLIFLIFDVNRIERRSFSVTFVNSFKASSVTSSGALPIFLVAKYMIIYTFVLFTCIFHSPLDRPEHRWFSFAFQHNWLFS